MNKMLFALMALFAITSFAADKEASTQIEVVGPLVTFRELSSPFRLAKIDDGKGNTCFFWVEVDGGQNKVRERLSTLSCVAKK